MTNSTYSIFLLFKIVPIVPFCVAGVSEVERTLPRMDSYFKAAVCDLDKLLDDFELNAGWTSFAVIE